MRRHLVPCAIVIGIALGLSACTDPYDPGQRAVGGGLIGAGAGAAIGGAAGGGQGALTGALIGGAVGAVGGAATTPQPPPAARLLSAAARLLPVASRQRRGSGRSQCAGDAAPSGSRCVAPARPTLRRRHSSGGCQSRRRHRSGGSRRVGCTAAGGPAPAARSGVGEQSDRRALHRGVGPEQAAQASGTAAAPRAPCPRAARSRTGGFRRSRAWSGRAPGTGSSRAIVRSGEKRLMQPADGPADQ